MVVTRKTPVVPAPPASRTASSQGHPRSGGSQLSQDNLNVSKSSSPLSQQRIDPPAEVPNGPQSIGHDINDALHKQHKKKVKSKKASKKSKKSNFQAFLDFLTKLLMLCVTIYTLSVCPQDTHLQSPICRGLHEYRRLVLEPYILPPILAALAHPSVAPYVERAKPYVDQAVILTTPILLRTQSEWNARVLPQWKKRVIPQWNKYVIPQWEKHAAPHIEALDAKIDPYLVLAQQTYERRILPHAKVATSNLQRWSYKAQPYVVLAFSKTLEGFQAVKPYVIPLGRWIALAIQQFALFLQDLRQKFVDPHVAKIWDKVKELSSRTPDPSTTLQTDAPVPSPVVEEEAFMAEPTPFSLAHVDILETLASESFVLSEPAPQSASVTPPAILSLYVDLSSSIASVSSSSEPSNGARTPLETLESASSVISESIQQPPTPTPATAIAEDITTSSTPSTSSVFATSISAEPTPDNQPAKFTHQNDDDIDLDAFYAELGLEDSDFQDHVESNSAPAPVETEEERAEKLRLKTEETVRKRADILARHQKWEGDLQIQMASSKGQLLDALQAIRKEAAAELESSTDIRTSVDGLVADGEKYLKGAEVYLKNLKSEGRKREEKVALWERVVSKVDGKFAERLKNTEGVVNTWYGLILDSELQQVDRVAAIVKDIAERGQVDLGLDYAWLDDVTYGDWQRYHDLTDTSERFKHEVLAIQNGTDLSAPSNPIEPILEDLELEVQDIVVGFETRLRRIKRDGERAFSNSQKEEERSPEPEISILPIPENVDEAGEYIPPVVIGRSKEEVLEALKKVEAPEDSNFSKSPQESKAEEVVDSLEREVKEHQTPDPAMYRTEL